MKGLFVNLKMKIAILGSYSTQILSKSLSSLNHDFDIYEAEFSQIDYDIINNDSNLYVFKPDFIIIHETSISFKKKFNNNSYSKNSYYKHCISSLEVYVEKLGRLMPNAKIIYPTLDINSDMIFGNYFFKIPESLDAQVHYYNYELSQLVLRKKNLFLLDINNLIFYSDEVRDERLVVTADIHFSISFTRKIAESINKIIQASLGHFIKCIVLDLDNTLWGGVIGDDGIKGIEIGDLGIGKAFSEFQKWLKSLKERGIILCICSKNDESIAKRPFLDHPDMILSLKDIAIFIANWDNKVTNIQKIKQVLNIDYDSILFIDDNPVERDMVKSAIDKIIVPDIPIDPAMYKDYLIKKNYFEITNFSKFDNERTKKYQEENKRKTLERSSFSLNDYLKSLSMEAEYEIVSKNIIPRVSQLTQRTNQFNARTIRYNEEEIKKISVHENYFASGFSLKDKFGSHGLVGLVILKKITGDSIFLDTFNMSCRVFNRGFEDYIFNYLKSSLKKRGFKYLVVEWIPSGKNSLISEFFSRIGFKNFKNNESKLDIEKIKLENYYIN